MGKERLERLKKVLAKIERSSRLGNSFDEMEELRKQEYHLEGGKGALYTMGNYRHNLEQTGWKQAAAYIAAKRRCPKKREQ